MQKCGRIARDIIRKSPLAYQLDKGFPDLDALLRAVELRIPQRIRQPKSLMTRKLLDDKLSPAVLLIAGFALIRTEGPLFAVADNLDASSLYTCGH